MLLTVEFDDSVLMAFILRVVGITGFFVEVVWAVDNTLVFMVGVDRVRVVITFDVALIEGCVVCTTIDKTE